MSSRWLVLLAPLFACEPQSSPEPISTPIPLQEGPISLFQKKASSLYEALSTKLQGAAQQAAMIAPSPAPGGTWTEGDLPALPLSQFMLVTQGEGGYQVVLSNAPEESWASDAPHFVFTLDPLVVSRPVSAEKLPGALAAWSGQTVRLFSEEGPLCEAKVEKFSLTTLAPSNDFAGQLYEAQGGKAALAQIAQEVWDATQEEGPRLLTASLSFSRECNGARFARLASLPNPKIAKVGNLKGRLADQAIKQFRKLPAYADVQSDYKSQINTVGFFSYTTRWDTLDGAEPVVSILQAPGEQDALFWISASSGYYGCEGALFSLEAAFTSKPQDGGIALAPLAVGSPSEALIYPRAALDVDGDGAFEIISEDTLWRVQDGRYQEWATIDMPTYAEEYCGE